MHKPPFVKSAFIQSHFSMEILIESKTWEIGYRDE
jgi:hypothetical protein